MTDRGEPQSQFTARADNAALKLRQSLQQQGRQVADNAPVLVDATGKPPAPPPPEGSYMSQIVQQQRAEDAQQLGDQPVAGTTEQMIDGSQAPPLADGEEQTPEPAQEQLSDNANRRIRELIAELKAKEAENSQLLDLGRKQGETLAQMQRRMEALQAQHEQLVQSNLDHLDPETRMEVMQDARLKEALAGMEQRIMGQLMPKLQKVEQNNVQAEMMRLGEDYPAFDIQIHGPLIDMFRGKNPHCSIEQAFRAIAEPNELISRAAASAAAVPPVVPPGNMGARPRYQPEPTQQSNPEEELVEEAQRIRKLRESTNPGEQKMGMDLVHEHLKRRLGL
jgi:hypothetical protein